MQQSMMMMMTTMMMIYMTMTIIMLVRVSIHCIMQQSIPAKCSQTFHWNAHTYQSTPLPNVTNSQSKCPFLIPDNRKYNHQGRSQGSPDVKYDYQKIISCRHLLIFFRLPQILHNCALVFNWARWKVLLNLLLLSYIYLIAACISDIIISFPFKSRSANQDFLPPGYLMPRRRKMPTMFPQLQSPKDVDFPSYVFIHFTLDSKQNRFWSWFNTCIHHLSTFLRFY